MRIVILCESFAQDMGYLSGVLPKYLARGGAEVHVVALDVPPERIDIHLDGNGVAVRQDDGAALTRALAALADPAARARLGNAGARLMREEFGWEHAARVRMRHFEDVALRR